MRSLLCAALLYTTTTAFAEDRSMVVNIGGTAGALERSSDVMEGQPADSLVGPRLTLAWEHAPLTLPATPGFNVEGVHVPDLTAGSFVNDQRADVFVRVGLRAELKMAQREQGLLKVSARGGMYIAGRGLIVGEKREPMLEFAIGEYLTRMSTWTRAGFEFAVVTVRRDTLEQRDWGVGGVFQFFIGFAP
jgi:hypothetical protein